jgi:DNA-binding NarL/FixJ family response regulator
MRGSRDSPMSVLVVDPHRQQRERIRGIVDASSELEVAAVAGSREHASELFWELWPDAAIIDVSLLSACEHPLHGWGSIPGEVRLIAVGPAEDPWMCSRLRAAGFCAYLPEDRLDDELCETVREAIESGAGNLRSDSSRFRATPGVTPVLAGAGRDERFTSRVS